MALMPVLAALHPGIPLIPPPPPPAEVRPIRQAEGSLIRANGRTQPARWRIERGELWLTLEFLENQLGVQRSSGERGMLQLEWFGSEISLPARRQQSLGDEVAVPVSDLLRRVGVHVEPFGKNELSLELPVRPLQAIRARDNGISGRRVVLDLKAPALVRSDDGQLAISAEGNPEQLRQLAGLGLKPRQENGWLQLEAKGERLTLGRPWRLVLDLPSDTALTSLNRPSGTSPNTALASLQRQGLALNRTVDRIGNRQVLINSVQLDPRRVPVDLRPLNRSNGMKGLSSLSQLARNESALIAINGGFFNRVNRLPLGALKDNGQWLSGPILNRGAVGWGDGELPQFDRLRLQESVLDPRQRRWSLISLNSGYVQKGLARYTEAWGPRYQPLTGQELGFVLRNGVVQQRIEGIPQPGVPLRAGDELLVARGGVQVDWQPGERLVLSSRSTSVVGDKPFVVGGGPLLLRSGLVALNGQAEGFSPGFIRQGAPRTVIASDGRQLWLITLQGVNNAGPTLMETALLLKQRGLKEALNLDGGSSTGLVLADVQTVKGRGIAGSVHNGIGLIPRAPMPRPNRPPARLASSPP